MSSASTALILVDVQNDFCEGGSLAVAGGAAVASAISAYVTHNHDRYAAIVATADWHHDPGDHFSDTPDFVDSWPAHCRAGSDGALFHPDAEAAFEHVEAIFRKGRDSAAYSGFEGITMHDGHSQGLRDWLQDKGIEAVHVVGIATDYCVRATALDAAQAGFDTTVLVDLTAAVADRSRASTLRDFADAGIAVREAG